LAGKRTTDVYRQEISAPLVLITEELVYGRQRDGRKLMIDGRKLGAMVKSLSSYNAMLPIFKTTCH